MRLYQPAWNQLKNNPNIPLVISADQALHRRIYKAIIKEKNIDSVFHLDMDFKGNPFGSIPALMATAEYVTKVHAVCTRTGNLANYSFRKTDNDKLVMLGETEEYEPLSRAAYYHAMRKDDKNSESHKPNNKD